MLSARILALCMAALAGALMALQGSLNSVLGKAAGLWEATFFVQVTGTLLALASLPLVGEGSLQKIWSAPWYTWLGGILGVAIIFTVAASIPKVGAAALLTAIIIAAQVPQHVSLTILAFWSFATTFHLVAVVHCLRRGWCMLRQQAQAIRLW